MSSLHITKFSQIPNQLPYPTQCKGKLSTIHSEIVMILLSDTQRTVKYLKDTISLLNTVSYQLLHNDECNWKLADGSDLDFSQILDDSDIREFLDDRDMYVAFKNIQWELDNVTKVSKKSASIKDISVGATKVVESADLEQIQPISQPVVTQYTPKPAPSIPTTPSAKEDLYIRPPVVPRFSVDKPVVSYECDGSAYVIYTSLPEIPKSQNEISITTDVTKMTSKDLLGLFPSSYVRTRAAVMYEPVEGIELHPILGLILPIHGYSRDELIQNLVEFPHLYKLTKIVDNKPVSFYTTVEIAGSLHKISDVWKDLPESSLIPYTSDFVKEYVVRRYLLEKTYRKVEHKYPMYGTLESFLTLFTTPGEYHKLGYSDPEYLAKSCVTARVSYKKSRNPILRRLGENV